MDYYAYKARAKFEHAGDEEERESGDEYLGGVPPKSRTHRRARKCDTVSPPERANASSSGVREMASCCAPLAGSRDEEQHLQCGTDGGGGGRRHWGDECAGEGGA